MIALILVILFLVFLIRYPEIVLLLGMILGTAILCAIVFAVHN